MSDVWTVIIALTVATALIKAAGPVLLGARDLPGRSQAVIGLIAPALLAALVVVETLSAPGGGAIEIDARVAGIAAAAIALRAGATMLPTVAIAALTVALLRLFT